MLCRVYDLRWISERVEAPREYSKVLRKLQTDLTDEQAHEMTTRHFDLLTLPKVMAFHGIKAFKMIRTHADGDCLYRCFAKVVQSEMPAVREDDIVTALRNRTEDVIEKCAQVFPEIADMIRQRFEMPGEAEDRRDTKAKPFEAMDTIHILATLLQVDVLVVFKEEEEVRRDRRKRKSAAPYRSVLYSSDALLTMLSGMMLGNVTQGAAMNHLPGLLDERAQVLGKFMGRAALRDGAGDGGEDVIMAVQGSRGLMVIHGSSLSAMNQSGHFDLFAIPKRIGKIIPGASELDRHINLERMLSLAITGTLHSTIDDRETRQMFVKTPLRLGTSLVVTPDLTLEFIRPPPPSTILGLMTSPTSNPISHPFTSSIFSLSRLNQDAPTMEWDEETHEVTWKKTKKKKRNGGGFPLTLDPSVPLPGPITLPPPISPFDHVLQFPEPQVDQVTVLESEQGQGILEEGLEEGLEEFHTLVKNSQRLWTRENELREMSEQEKAKVSKALVVRDSTIQGSGKGLFATRRIPKNTKLGAYTGKCFESMDQLEAYRTKHGLPLPSAYVFEASNSACRLIDGDYRAYPEEACILAYMNHSPTKANVRFTAKGNVEAKQDIEPGQEIFVSYGKSYRMPPPPPQPSSSLHHHHQHHPSPATAFTSGMSLRLDRSLLDRFKDVSLQSGGVSIDDGRPPFLNLDDMSPIAPPPAPTVNLRVYTRQAPHVHDFEKVDPDNAVRIVAESLSLVVREAGMRLVFAFNGLTATPDKLRLLGELIKGRDFVEVVFMSDCMEYVANADGTGDFPMHLPAAIQGGGGSGGGSALSIFEDDEIAAAACATYLDARWRNEIRSAMTPDARHKLFLLAGYGSGRRLASYMLHMTEGKAKAEALFDLGKLVDIDAPGKFIEAFGQTWESLRTMSSLNDVLVIKGWKKSTERIREGDKEEDSALVEERMLDGYACVGMLFDEEDDDGLLFMQTDVSKCIEILNTKNDIRQNVPPTPSVPLPLAKYSVWVRRSLQGFAKVTDVKFAKKTRDLWTSPNFHHLRKKYDALTPELLTLLCGGTEVEELGELREAILGVPLRAPMLVGVRSKRGGSQSRSVCVQLFSNEERGVRGWFLASQAFRARASVASPILCPRIQRLAHIPSSTHTHLFGVSFYGRASRSLLSSIMSAVLVGESGSGSGSRSGSGSGSVVEEPVLSDLVRRMVVQMAEEDVAKVPREIRENVDAVLRIERHECTGRGLFAVSAIGKDTFLGHYTGRLQSTKARGNEWYVWDLGNGQFVDGDYTKWQEAGYLSMVNTGPYPNVEGVLGMDADGEPALSYVVIRDIAPGEQLIIDYGPSYLDFISARYEDALFRARRAMAWTARCLAAFQRVRAGILISSASTSSSSRQVRQVAEDWLSNTVRILDEDAMEADHVDVSWPGSMVTCTGMWDRVVHSDLDKGVKTVDPMEMLNAMAQVIVDKLVECAAGSVPFEPRHEVDKLVRVATRVLAEEMVVVADDANEVSIMDASDLLKPVDGMLTDLQAFVRLALSKGAEGMVAGAADFGKLLERTVNLDTRPGEPFHVLNTSGDGDSEAWMSRAEATMNTTLDLAIKMIRNEIPRSTKTFRPLAIHRVTPHYVLWEDLDVVEANSREIADPTPLAAFLKGTIFGDVPLENLRFLEGQTFKGIIITKVGETEEIVNV